MAVSLRVIPESDQVDLDVDVAARELGIRAGLMRGIDHLRDFARGRAG
jgi:hypothetical protein